MSEEILQTKLRKTESPVKKIKQSITVIQCILEETPASYPNMRSTTPRLAWCNPQLLNYEQNNHQMQRSQLRDGQRANHRHNLNKNHLLKETTTNTSLFQVIHRKEPYQPQSDYQGSMLLCVPLGDSYPPNIQACLRVAAYLLRV
ncbi:unnamed protein product [Hermetia illucens]|uniref:Uncharacterized protein n=1 Tax=Hermetia illucens TaxID=343691 RepID=A0A7R8UMQ6_HERIL|nr:unnamed protein product [Hermetia illucens]